jgi:hypothetical protein
VSRRESDCGSPGSTPAKPLILAAVSNDLGPDAALHGRLTEDDVPHLLLQQH